MTSGTKLFDRKCILIAGTKRIENLRIAFNVEKDPKRDPNKATIVVNNLSKESRAAISDTGIPIVLDAGYQQQSGIIFTGEAYKITHKYNGPDIETTIEAADGGEEVKRKIFSKSFAKGVQASVVIKTIVSSLGLDLSTGSTITPNPVTFRNGWAYTGSAADALELATQATGLEWTINNRQVLIWPKEKVGIYGVDVLLSSETGMIGSPEELEKDKETKRRKFQVQCLMNPNIAPKSTVKIESVNVPKLNGRYEVETVKIAGDTHGNEWSMILGLKMI